MKNKTFKLENNKLFVFKSKQSNSKLANDPTTTLVTITLTMAK
jgi:hypothetical protein